MKLEEIRKAYEDSKSAGRIPSEGDRLQIELLLLIATNTQPNSKPVQRG